MTANSNSSVMRSTTALSRAFATGARLAQHVPLLYSVRRQNGVTTLYENTQPIADYIYDLQIQFSIGGAYVEADELSDFTQVRGVKISLLLGSEQDHLAQQPYQDPAFRASDRRLYRRVETTVFLRGFADE